MWKLTKGYSSACKSSWKTMFQFCLSMEFRLEEKNELTTKHFQRKWNNSETNICSFVSVRLATHSSFSSLSAILKEDLAPLSWANYEFWTFFSSFLKQMESIHCKKVEVQHKTWAIAPSKPKTPSLPHNATTTWWLVKPSYFSSITSINGTTPHQRRPPWSY